MKKRISFLFILLLLANLIYPQTIKIYTGNSVTIPLGNEVCADTIIVYEGASYITEDSSGTCESATIIGDGNIVLPVELTSLSVNYSNNQVLLNWKTETEKANYGFEIERATDKINWIKIGYVEGHGNSNTPIKYSFADKNPTNGNLFYYRLKQIDTDGKYKYSDAVEIKIIPKEFRVFQNYPNPFNNETKIKYQLPIESQVLIKVYNILGEEIISVINETNKPGIYEVWVSGDKLTSGTYIYTFQTENFFDVKKMILLK